MKRPALQFSHANGFPASSYGAMLGALAPRYRVAAIEAFGADARYPVTERWLHLVEQLENEVELRWRGEPVYGVGHSLGGYLTFLAAVRRPELFRAIVLLDAPILGPVTGTLLGATKRFGIVDRVTPAGATRDRRSVWPNREEARAHFRSRRLYRHFDDACLDDYVRHALVWRQGELHLKIPPETEYRVYRCIPHDMSRHVARLRVPAGFVGGVHSDVIRRVGLGMMRAFRKRRVPGGHLFPLERPREAAAAIEELLAELG